MARPLKDGIDYFPFDVGFLQDKKIRLIKGEYGAKGVLVVIHLLCSIYKGNGYFTTCDNDDCILVADAVGCGCDANTIREVVQGCLRRSVFDNRVFEVFGVLTSRGIQRRYLRAVNTRESIEIIKEYWLLDINDKKDVPTGISKKIAFKTVNLQNNPDKTQRNPVNLQNNPIKKSKVKKSKVKKSKVEGATAPIESIDPEMTAALREAERCGFQITAYMADEIDELISAYSGAWVQEAIKRAAERGKRTLSYVKGILKNWQSAGAIDDARLSSGGKVQRQHVPKRYMPPDEKKEVTAMPEELRKKLKHMF